MVKKLQFVVCTFIALGAIENVTAASPELGKEAQSRITRMQAPVPPVEPWEEHEIQMKKIAEEILEQKGSEALQQFAATKPEYQELLHTLTPEERTELESHDALHQAGKRPLNQAKKLFIAEKLNQLGPNIFDQKTVGDHDQWTPEKVTEVICVLADMISGYLPTGGITTEKALKIVEAAGFLKKDASGEKYELNTDKINQLPNYCRTMLAASLMPILNTDGSIASIELTSDLEKCTWNPFKIGIEKDNKWDELKAYKQANILCLYAIPNYFLPDIVLKRYFSGTEENPVNTEKIKEICKTLLPQQRLLFWGTLICMIDHLSLPDETKLQELKKMLKDTPYWREEYLGIIGRYSYLLSRIESTIVQKIIRDLEKGGFKKEADQLRALKGKTYGLKLDLFK